MSSKTTHPIALRRRLESINILRKSTSNWVELVRWVSQGIGSEVGPPRVDARFRDGLVIEGTSDPRLILNLSRYYVYSHIIGSYSQDDFRFVQSLFSDISTKMSKVFNRRDFTIGTTGGSIDTKESVIFALIRRFRPSRFLETGVAQGVTSEVILSAMSLNGGGKLVSVDWAPPDRGGFVDADGNVEKVSVPGGLEPGWLVSESNRDQWRLIQGKTSDVLPTLTGEFDAFLHDSDHSYANVRFELEWAFSHLSMNGVLLADDISRNRAFRDFAASHSDLVPLIHTPDFGNLVRMKRPGPSRPLTSSDA